MADASEDFLAGSSLLPEEPGLTPAEDLDSAVASALEDASVTPADDPIEPFGVTWLFDYERGRFVRSGLSPARVTGISALEMWCWAALYTALDAHAIYADTEFGTESPDGVIGTAASTEEEASDWAANAREALLVHERIADVDITVDVDRTTGVVTITKLDVYTDEEGQEIVSLEPFSVDTV